MWPVVLAVVVALVLAALVATAVIVANRAMQLVAEGALGNGPLPPPASTPTPPASTQSSPASASETSAPVPVPPAATATTAPTPSTTSTSAPPPGPDRSLQGNALYSVDLGRATVRCELEVRRPKPPLANKKLAPYLREVVSCLTKAFAKPLAAKGFVLREPKVTTYHRSVKTPCGTFGQKGSPAYYCSSTQTIYWPDTVDDGNEAYTFARLGYVGLAAHEFGHHVQASTGMLDDYAQQYAKASKSGRYALSRRLELQAQCFEGVFLAVARTTLGLRGYDRTELRAWHDYTGDEDPPKSRKPDHGSSKAQYRWLERGWKSGDFGRCNTWKADSSDVR